jgi:hypothetical protein
LPSSYRAYGLRCVSERPIPGFLPERSQPTSPDVAIWIGSEQPSWAREACALPANIRYAAPAVPRILDCGCTVISRGSDRFFEISYGDGARFLIDGAGTRLCATWAAPLTFEDVATYLRGPAMGFVLRLRGVTALHASAVCVDGRAVVLCGSREAGKSTTAAAFARRGVLVLSDDIAALHAAEGVFQIAPGYPQICLWPDAVQHLFGAPDALPRLTPDWDKCFLPLDDEKAKFDDRPRPLHAIYLLDIRRTDADAPRIEDITPRTAVVELIQHTYMNYLLDPQQRAAEFDVLTSLATRVPVRRIIPHSDTARLSSLCDLILRDAERLCVADAPIGVAAGHN